VDFISILVRCRPIHRGLALHRNALSFAISAVIGLAAPAAMAQPAVPELALTRLDCGTSAGPTDVARFSDTFTHVGLQVPFVYSCYLVRHGDDYLLWDTGHSMNAGAVAPKVSVVDQLAQLNVKPEQVRFVGISHYHPDHTGQVASFPGATLLIGKGDWDVITSPKPPPNAPAAPFAHWIGGAGKMEVLPLDKDVFGDASVIVLATPGHTPGHHSLLVKLKQMGPVVITGDLAHFHENYETNGVPPFNTGRAETLASLDRVKKIVANLKATVIIQHDGRDIAKLPTLPASAR
jgi:glyoxylase-like metal-dependent hydrolase (beta-lactamase superfamily II)